MLEPCVILSDERRSSNKIVLAETVSSVQKLEEACAAKRLEQSSLHQGGSDRPLYAIVRRESGVVAERAPGLFKGMPTMSTKILVPTGPRASYNDFLDEVTVALGVTWAVRRLFTETEGQEVHGLLDLVELQRRSGTDFTLIAAANRIPAVAIV